jgi:predicted transposase/invertase (TIGR01784 family)
VNHGPIDPTVDCVFKAILGAEENVDLLVHFLNAVTRPERPIVAVQLQNPYNAKEFDHDKLTVVDVKARDAAGVMYQVEVQLVTHKALAERILYTWARLFQAQMEQGHDWIDLQPVVSIWLLTGRVFEAPRWRHHFRAVDTETGLCLSRFQSIHVLELGKWSPPPELDDVGRWAYFFQKAKDWDRLPTVLDTPELRRAMSILHRFSEKEEDYWRYQARKDFLAEQATIRRELDEARAETERAREAAEQARAGEEQARACEEQARAEAERLRARLRALGIDPEA